MKKVVTMILLISLTLLISGCWSKRELNELAIVVAMGIDKVDDGYEVTLQVVDPGEISSKGASSGRAPVVTYHAKGKSIFEAIRQMTALSPRKSYFAHLQMVVIGEAMAAEGISQTLELLSRDHEIRHDFKVILTKNTTTKEVLSVYTPIEKIPANKMLNSLKTSQDAWGSTLSVNIDELINKLNSNEKNTVLSAIEIEGDPQLGYEKSNVETIRTPVLLKYTGLGIIKHDKLIGFLTEQESIGYNYLNNKVTSTIEGISCPDEGQLTIEVTKSKAKIKVKVEHGIPKFNVNIDVDQKVAEVRCNINLAELKTLELINKKTEKEIKEKVEHSLQTIQKKYQADTLGFGEYIHRSDPKAWKKIKDEWSTIFPDVEVNVTVKVTTQELGTTQNSKLYNSKE